MWDNEQTIWQEIQDTWNNQPQNEKINIQVSKLVNEFKNHVTDFEKGSINSDLTVLKTNWTKVKSDKISQFEKDSIKKDINTISNFLNKIINKFKR